MITTVRLTDREVDVLRETLGSVLSDLRMEIADTDLKDFRDQLKARRALLEIIVGKLDDNHLGDDLR